MATIPATNSQARAIKRRMAQIRSELPVSADLARARVGQLTDWKYHLSRRPLPILIATAAAGYWLVPAKSKPSPVVISPVATGPLPIHSAAMTQSAAPAKKSIIGGIAGAIGTMVLRQATTALVAQAQSRFARQTAS